MSRDNYIFVMRDHGQDICDECKLRGDDDLEVWENFINGEMTPDPPVIPGFYPALVLVRSKGEMRVLEARQAKNNKNACVWADPKIRSRVKARWSLPYPWPAIYSPKEAN